MRPRITAADMIWIEKADLNASILGGIAAIAVTALPLFLL